MRMPVSDVMQPRGEALIDLTLLGASVWAKSKPATHVAVSRARSLFDVPLVPVDARKELATRFALPPRGLTMAGDMLDYVGADENTRA
jgi:hypothetical protein